jgi:hypothetical protein
VRYHIELLNIEAIRRYQWFRVFSGMELTLGNGDRIRFISMKNPEDWIRDIANAHDHLLELDRESSEVKVFEDSVPIWMDDERTYSRDLPLAVDSTVGRDDSGLPAFLTRFPEEPVYFGFPVLDDVEVDGFRLGMISDFEAEESTWGDAFVVAPDGSRGGLIWVVEGDDHWWPGGFDQASPPEAGRWGVWHVAFPCPMRTRDDARRNLEAVVPMLRKAWLEWRERFPKE